jgi:hypothetical protein
MVCVSDMNEHPNNYLGSYIFFIYTIDKTFIHLRFSISTKSRLVNCQPRRQEPTTKFSQRKMNSTTRPTGSSISTAAGIQSLGRHRTGDEEMLVGFRPAETARGFHGAAGRSIGAGVCGWVVLLLWRGDRFGRSIDAEVWAEDN